MKKMYHRSQNILSSITVSNIDYKSAYTDDIILKILKE